MRPIDSGFSDNETNAKETEDRAKRGRGHRFSTPVAQTGRMCCVLTMASRMVRWAGFDNITLGISLRPENWCNPAEFRGRLCQLRHTMTGVVWLGGHQPK